MENIHFLVVYHQNASFQFWLLFTSSNPSCSSRSTKLAQFMIIFGLSKYLFYFVMPCISARSWVNPPPPLNATILPIPTVHLFCLCIYYIQIITVFVSFLCTISIISLCPTSSSKTKWNKYSNCVSPLCMRHCLYVIVSNITRPDCVISRNHEKS